MDTRQLAKAVEESRKTGTTEKLLDWLLKTNRVPYGVSITKKDGRYVIDYGTSDTGLL